MGAEIHIEHGYIEATTAHLPNQRLQGARYYMDLVTVTGTENLMMAAALAQGTTVLENAAKEPEVVDMAECLIKMGAKISGAGTDVITIVGVDRLTGASHNVVCDRIEAGTYMVAVAMTGGEVKLLNVQPKLLDAVMAHSILSASYAKIRRREERESSERSRSFSISFGNPSRCSFSHFFSSSEPYNLASLCKSPILVSCKSWKRQALMSKASSCSLKPAILASTHPTIAVRKECSATDSRGARTVSQPVRETVFSKPASKSRSAIRVFDEWIELLEFSFIFFTTVPCPHQAKTKTIARRISHPESMVCHLYPQL